MNIGQRYVLVIGLLLVFGMILVPPWSSEGYAPVFAPPYPGDRIDVVRLLFQVAAVLVFSVAMWVMFKSDPAAVRNVEDRSAESGECEAENIARRDSGDQSSLYVLSAFVGVLLLVVGWHFYGEWEKELEARREWERTALIETNRERVRQEVVSEQVERAARFREYVTSLAVPRLWPVIRTSVPGISARLFTYWKDGNLYFQVKLTGGAEALEHAGASHQNYKIVLRDTDGVEVFSASVNASELRPQGTSAGMVSALATDKVVHPCAMEIYEKLRAWEFIGE